MFCNNTRIYLIFKILCLSEQAQKALHTTMNFFTLCMHAQKRLQIVHSGAGPTLLYVCRALCAFAVLAQRAGKYRMKEGFMPWHSLSVSCSACTHTEATPLALSPRVPCSAQGGSCQQASSSFQQPAGKAELCSHALSSSAWDDDRDHC